MEDSPPGEMREVVHARGHENVSAEHGSTFEITTDDWLTPAGDCILAVEADRAPAAFADAFVDACRNRDATIRATLTATTDEGDTHTATIVGRGHPGLSFENERSHVGRTSDYVDDRTILVDADAAAADLDRDLVDALAAGADLRVELAVEPADG
nr:DUF371 domain-containing protein [Halobellus sp. DFY28]